MQNSFHPLICALALLSAALPAWALSPEDNGFRDQASELQLIGSGTLLRGTFHAGIEITLKRDALTYWRQPGDAGVPPVFSFEGSSNLATAEVLYPAPTRIKEDEGEAFGYREKVVFPLHVTPRDKAQPVVLKLTAEYAVCERICIPAKSRAELILPSSSGESQAASLAAAEALLPRRLSDAEARDRLRLVAEPHAAHPAWRLSWKDAAAATDLFAEAPDGWYFETKKTAVPNEFTIIAVEMPKQDMPSPVPVTLTLTSPTQNFEFTLPLEASDVAR